MKKNILILMLVAGLLAMSTTYAAENLGYSVKVTFISQTPDPVEPGKYVDLRWKFENTGYNPVSGVVAQLLPEYPFSLDSSTEAIQNISTLGGQQIGDSGVIVYYKVRVDQNAVQGNNTIKLRYKTSAGVWSKEEDYTVRVQSYDVLLYLEDVKAVPETVEPGKHVVITMTFKNMASSALKNIKVNMQLIQLLTSAASSQYIELPFSPSGSSSEKIIEKLYSGTQKDVVFDMLVDASASSKIYKIPITLSYKDEWNNEYTKNEIVSIVVNNKPDLLVQPETDSTLTVGTTNNAVFKIINRGLSQVKFLSVNIGTSDKYQVVSPLTYYVGNIDSDDYATAEFKLSLKSSDSGKISVPLTIHYHDANNNEYTDTVNEDVNVYSAQELQNLGITPKSNTGTIVVVIIVVLVVVGFFVIRRFRKKRK